MNEHDEPFVDPINVQGATMSRSIGRMLERELQKRGK